MQSILRDSIDISSDLRHAVSEFLLPTLTNPVPNMASFSPIPYYIFLVHPLLHLSHAFLITSFSPTPYYIFLTHPLLHLSHPISASFTQLDRRLAQEMAPVGVRGQRPVRRVPQMPRHGPSPSPNTL